MNNYIILTLKELVKSYTIQAEIARNSRKADDLTEAKNLLTEINNIRISLGLSAEMFEIFYSQIDVTATTPNYWFSKNDINYVIKQGIASLKNTTKLSLENTGAKNKVITRSSVSWQSLFADIQQTLPVGQQTLFELPESLRFGKNQALNIGFDGQDENGWLWLHGATIKESLEKTTKNGLESEFINDRGETTYLPETQVIPIEFVFSSNAVGTPATSVNGDKQIFSNKNNRSVLLLGVSTTASDCRIDKLTDEGRNQTICESIEMRGIAANFQNPFEVYYSLPYPHLLRQGDRLRLSVLNGSLITNNEQAANTLYQLIFHGITL